MLTFSSWHQVSYLDVQGDGLVLEVYSELVYAMVNHIIYNVFCCNLHLKIRTAIFHTKCVESLILIPQQLIPKPRGLIP